MQRNCRCRCRGGAGAEEVLVHRCRCIGAGAEVQVHRCRCRDVADKVVQRWCGRGGAGVVERCSDLFMVCDSVSVKGPSIFWGDRYVQWAQ